MTKFQDPHTVLKYLINIDINMQLSTWRKSYTSIHNCMQYTEIKHPPVIWY